MRVNADARGALTALDFSALGLAVVRVFTVTAADGASRGAHGHYRGRQLLVAVSGEIELELRRNDAVATVTLRPDGPAILVEPGVWGRQTYRGAAPILLVLCDTRYDSTDYFEATSETF
jgi:hypothetical protein